MLRNLKASANSINPSVTFTELSQPPDCGNLFMALGKKAKNMKGKAKAEPKTAIPKIGRKTSAPVAEATKSVPYNWSSARKRNQSERKCHEKHS